MDTDLKIELTKTPKEKPTDESKLGFGNIFTDHMFIVDHDRDTGWHDARIVPYQNLSLSPAASVFHYGTEIFEGLKAYRWDDGSIKLFRPVENIRRMNNSADRLCLPQIPEGYMLYALKKFVDIEKDWVPKSNGTSLYLRPFMIGVDPSLGVHTITKSMFIIIASPSGSYYPEGINPVKIMIETEDVRACVGGTGDAKCGGNYAASLRAGHKAELKGYTQVLWLDAVKRRYIEEVGAMNVMFKINGVVVTPALKGSVLPGVTRKSCIQLLRDKGIPVEERDISVRELYDAQISGKLEEAWGTGTAAVISPIGELCFRDEKMTINDFKIGEVSQWLYNELTGIQWGKVEDKYGWISSIEDLDLNFDDLQQ